MFIKPKKSLGQHFLMDGNIIRKIAESLKPEPNDQIIEIGPGTGALTRVLFAKYPDMLAVEVDSRAIEVLKKELPELRVIQKDVLKIDWNDHLRSTKFNKPQSGTKIYDSKFNKSIESDSRARSPEHGEPSTEHEPRISIIGNLPYYLTSPILFSVLDNRQNFSQAVFMIQKEVAQRLVAVPRTKDYGILSVQTQLLSRPELLFNVPPHVFNPPPKVDSSVIRLHFDQPGPDCDLALLKKVVRTAFNQRRKKLSNALSSIITSDADLTGIDLTRRAEELTPPEFVEMTRKIFNSDSDIESILN